MSDDGLFDYHIEKLVQSASQLSGWILRTFESRDELTMKTLYKSLIQSKLDYCSPLVIPSSAEMTMKLESVQRAFTRKIATMKEKNYWERLQNLKMYSVQRRRERFQIIYLFKVLNNLVQNPGVEFKKNPRTGTWAKVPKIDRKLPTFAKKMKVNSFAYSAPKLFNRLPKNLRDFTPSNETTNLTLSFKNHLDKFLQKIPDQPTVYGNRDMIRPANSNSIIDQINYISRV